MFSPHGPSLRELCVQALSSVERGYDLLAPKFDHTPFRTPAGILDATVHTLSGPALSGPAPSGPAPFGSGLDVCCGTGAGMTVLRRLCRGPVTGVDFSAGMLAQAREAHPDATWVRADARALPFADGFDLAVTFGALGHFLPGERPALFAGVHRALRPGGLFVIGLGTPAPVSSVWYWATLGFDVAMRVRNAVWRPPFVMYYRTTPLAALSEDLAAAGFLVRIVTATPSEGAGGLLILARKPGPAA
ncbi:class I SAM-dependent methyltransferase [Mangrovihabitans endophyticus]|uniref:Methyltransferase n=1 Tax=Mangrovihabitans endophyticus TaxID=1751298 RepID=A0A8J3C4B6_9ACTN|nr:class I SAM-dependent methyltransferase [Mangrovihabitans endophyticus]GGL07591.1 methyltransferase [Mangrovihabitans endophyticus]